MTSKVRVRIEKLVYGGWGLGRIDGRVVLVPYVLPEEEVEVRIERERRDYLLASLLEVLKPSEGRTDPPCPHFRDCGGCDYQHISYELQPRFKEEILKEELQRIGGIGPEAVERMIAAKSPLGWRLRAEMAVTVTDRLRVGFHRRGTGEVVEIRACPALHQVASGILERLREALERHLNLTRAIRRLEVAASPYEGKGHLIIHSLVHHDRKQIRKMAEELDAEELPLKDVLIKHRALVYPHSLLGKGRTASAIVLRPHGVELLCYPGVFFQANAEQNERLIALLKEALSGGVGRVLELFSGMGNLSLPLAPLVSSWIGVERDPLAVKNANYNAQINGVKNVRFLQGEALGVLEGLLKKGERYELLLLDPPREGAKRELGVALMLFPERIIYVSCNPATLARDLKFLKAEGYELERVIPLDFFPHTYHIEAVAFLRRVKSP